MARESTDDTRRISDMPYKNTADDDDNDKFAKLCRYRSLIGIDVSNVPRNLTTSSHDLERGSHSSEHAPENSQQSSFFDRAQQIGPDCYSSICKEERRMQSMYWLTTITLSAFLLGQVVIATLITVLSAKSSSPNTVTTLGAVSTAVGSIIVWFRGRGFPSRLYQYRNSLRNARRQAELMDRQFQVPQLAKKLEPETEALTVWTMWQNAVKDAQTNHPEFWDAGASATNPTVGTVLVSSSSGNGNGNGDVKSFLETSTVVADPQLAGANPTSPIVGVNGYTMKRNTPMPAASASAFGSRVTTMRQTVSMSGERLVA